MPRQPRYFLPNLPQHVVSRGVDRQPVFFQPADYRLYLQALRKAAANTRCQVHAYVLMTNHVHLLVTPEEKHSLPLMMQAMGRAYVQRFNARHRRTGTLWEGRYRASLVQTDGYLLACQRYIELNPVRAGLVAAPGDYLYSSYAYHALGKGDAVLTPHPNYLALHPDPAGRLSAYRALFSDVITEELLTRLRVNTNACAVIGDKHFKNRVEATLGRTVPSGRRGRPEKRG